MSILSLVGSDLRLQYRHGLYAAYAFIAIAYGVLLRALPNEARLMALPPLLLSEIAIIAFFFAGTILHLERGDGVIEALATSPLGPGGYLASKTVSLSLLAVSAGLAIVVAALGLRFQALSLAATTALTATAFSAAGLAVAPHFSSLDRFVLWSGLTSSILALPLLPYLGILESPLWMVLPTGPALTLLAEAVDSNRRTGTVAAPMALLAGWALLAWLVAHRTLARRLSGPAAGEPG